MKLLLATIGALLGAATLDGATTMYAIKRGWVEGNKLLVWLYRTDTPSALKTYGYGVGIVAVEGNIAVTLSHFYPQTEWYAVTLLGAQIVGHLVAAYQNYTAKFPK